MSRYSIAIFLSIMITINVGLWLWQEAIEDVNPDLQVINFTTTPAARFLGNASSLGDATLAATASDIGLETADNVDPDTGNIFTDVVKSVGDWWERMDARFSILTGILKQPYGFLKEIGTPNEIATAFGVIWYTLVSFLFIAFVKGGDH